MKWHSSSTTGRLSSFCSLIRLKMRFGLIRHCIGKVSNFVYDRKILRENMIADFRNMNPSIFSSCLLVLVSCISTGIVYSQHFSDDQATIDSLITINRLNENAMLVSFGADAVTAISTMEGIVVIDAGISARLTSRYRKRIENEFQPTRFMYVINTHGHHDHTRGNIVFSDAVIIGHVNSIREIERQNNNRERAAASLKRIAGEYDLKQQQSEQGTEEWQENFTQKYRCLYAGEDISDSILIKVPDSVFTDSLSIRLTDITFEMFYFGNYHSESDILVFVPELKLLFTGDLFTRYGRPSVNENLLPDEDRRKMSDAWLKERMGTIETIITGHGQILGCEDLEAFISRL